MPRSLAGSLLALASSGLLFLSGEPVGFGPLAWVALAPLFVAVFRERRRRRAAAYGLVFGLGYFGAHLAWIFLFGWMAWSALAVVLSLYVVGATVGVHLARRLPLAPVLAAGSWVAFELMRDRWPFGGFPWGAVGTTQGGVPGVRWLAGSVGVYGLSFLAAFVAAVVADRIVHGAWPLGSLGLVAGITVVFAVVDAAAYGSPPPGEQLRVVAIQSDVPRPRHAGEDEVIVADHIRLTREAVARSRPDLVVWPESAVGDSTPRGRIAALADEIGVPMLVGRYEADTEREAFLNLVELISEVGTYEAVYQKQHPVPFGEHVPLAFLRRYVTTLDQVPYDMVPGPGPRVFDVDGVRVATPICFESVFPRDMRAFARLGAEVVVVATNDASFERSYASEQHLAHTRMRALELRQWAVQSAISGISAVVAPDGTVSQRSELFEPAVIEAVVRARPASSLYTRVGDLYGWGWTAGTALAFGLWFATTLSGRRRRDDAAQASVDRETVG